MDFCFAHFVFRINEKLHIAQLAKANDYKGAVAIELSATAPFALKRKLGIDQKLVLGYSLRVAENVFLKENYNGQKCHISQNVRTVLLLSR